MLTGKQANSSPRPTLRSVAESAGVSVPTVSAVLNGHGDKLQISALTQRKVRRIAEKMRYSANPFARSLRLRRSNTIGVIWSFSFCGNQHLVRTFSEEAHKNGYAAMVYDSLSLVSGIKLQVAELVNRRVDGLVIQLQFGDTESYLDDILPLLKEIRSVVVVTDRELDISYPQIIQVRKNSYATAASYLLNAGRRCFTYIGRTSLPNKVEAIRGALEDSPFEGARFIETDFPESYSPENVLDRLDSRKMAGVDAIFASNDAVALDVIWALKRLGKSIPKDVAVIGFDNSYVAPKFDPPIASVERHDDVVVRAALDCVISNIKKPSSRTKKKFVNMDFVWRESAGLIPYSNSEFPNNEPPLNPYL